MCKKRSILFYIIIFLILVMGFLIPHLTQAQNWALMPPYNVLWPLWSPVLSPPDPITGLPTPHVPTITKNTILPVQPAIVWDPTTSIWALYNMPLALGSGLLYFDLTYGLNPFPPSYLLDSLTGALKPIALPLGYSVYLPVALKGFEYFIPLANLTYIAQYGLPISPFLTSADIWGYTPFSALPPAVF